MNLGDLANLEQIIDETEVAQCLHLLLTGKESK